MVQLPAHVDFQNILPSPFLLDLSFPLLINIKKEEKQHQRVSVCSSWKNPVLPSSWQPS